MSSHAGFSSQTQGQGQSQTSTSVPSTTPSPQFPGAYYPLYDSLYQRVVSHGIENKRYNLTLISATINSLFKHEDALVHEEEIMALITYQWILDGHNVDDIPYGGKYHFPLTEKYYNNFFKNFPPILSCIICEYILDQSQ